jgi:hypothetical protein
MQLPLAHYLLGLLYLDSILNFRLNNLSAKRNIGRELGLDIGEGCGIGGTLGQIDSPRSCQFGFCPEVTTPCGQVAARELEIVRIRGALQRAEELLDDVAIAIEGTL